MTLHAFRGEILSVPEDPVDGKLEAIRHFPDGLMVVEDGSIAAIGTYADLARRFGDVPTDMLPGILVPGFIDAHVRYPQIEKIASHGDQLLEWLRHHIFPAEAAFGDPAHAATIAAFFLDELLRNGTTSALVFATVHTASVDALFEAALSRDMHIISGKVLMDLGPETLRDTPESGRADTEALIAKWRGRGRLGYAVTPRFALTSSDAQLTQAGEIVAAHPEVLMHTHLSENLGEIAAVAGRFPDARDYLDVYDRFGLVGRRSVFAHCIHMSDPALTRMAEAGAGIAFCPTSNLFLGSGLFDLAACDSHSIRIGLGSDVGAGTSLSLLATMGEAYKVCQMRGSALDPFRALHLATAGGARVMGIADRVGGLMVGQEADFVVLDPAATPILARRTAGASLHDKLFALQILGDDRAIAATYLRGRVAHKRA